MKNHNCKIKEEFTVAEKKEFFSSFRVLYNSGVPFTECFQSMAETTSSRNIRLYCNLILNEINRGCSFTDALKKYSKATGLAYGALLAAGEESGTLDDILSEALKNIEKTEETIRNIISSLTYPCCILILALIVFMIFKFFILKVFQAMIEDISSLCMSSLIISATVKIVIILFITGGGIFCVYKDKKLRKNITNIICKLPVFAGIIKNYTYMNFFSILGLAYSAGVPVAEAIRLAAPTVVAKNDFNRLQKAAKSVEFGSDVTTALNVSKCFSKNVISRIGTGEKAGKLDKAFFAVALDFEKATDFKIKTISKVLEPLIMIFVGILVLYVVKTGYTQYYKGLFSMF